jgi:hypothetical protein
MPYTNTTKIANGATVQIGANTYEDAMVIGIPGNQVELIEITTLGSTRKEYTVSDMPDGPEITVQVPFTGTYPALNASGSAVTVVVITLPKISKTITFDALIIGVAPQPAEIDGKLMLEVTIKPVEAAA